MCTLIFQKNNLNQFFQEVNFYLCSHALDLFQGHKVHLYLLQRLDAVLSLYTLLLPTQVVPRLCNQSQPRSIDSRRGQATVSGGGTRITAGVSVDG